MVVCRSRCLVNGSKAIKKELQKVHLFFCLMAGSNFNRFLNFVSRQARNIEKSVLVVNNCVANGNCKEDLFYHFRTY